MDTKRAIITGLTGQDGSYLAELLLKKGYEVHGLVRRAAFEDQRQRFSRINHILDKITVHYGDVRDLPTVWRMIHTVQPDEIYHLASQSQVALSFKDDFGTLETNINGTHYLLDSIKNLRSDCKFYFAGTSEMFGSVEESPQNERTPFHPVSPYAISKLASFHLTKFYREAYGIFSCSGILFNHESPRRGFEFVTRKITSTVARIKEGKAEKLELGNLDSRRDWGFAGDYVEAMWLMLQRGKPNDYVIGSGKNYRVRDFVEAAFGSVDINIEWRGRGVEERGFDGETGKELVSVNKAYFRPLDVENLLADFSKAKRELAWEPKTKFDELVRMMVEADVGSRDHNELPR